MAKIVATSFILILLLVSADRVFAQHQPKVPGSAIVTETGSPFFVEIRPSFDLPMGQSAQYFYSGGTLDAMLHFRFATLFRAPLFGIGGITYTYLPDQAGKSTSVGSGSVGLAAQLRMSRAFRVEAFGSGGYFFAEENDGSVSSTNPYLEGGIGLELALTPGLKIGIAGVYRDYVGLYQGLGASIGTVVALGPEPPSEGGGLFSTSPVPLSGALSETKLEIPPLFPVFYQYYDDHPIGTVQITNTTHANASDIKATVYIKQYMDNPKTVAIPGTLAPGKSRPIKLYALFNDNVLSITEGTKVSAEITLNSTVDARKYRDKTVETVQFLNRDAMTWDDNRRAAAFVTAKDPNVLSFAKNVTAPIRDQEVRSINPSLETAIGIHDALDLYGMNYVSDPTTPYVVYSKMKDVPDFLQFPRQTLQYKSGDCDDLSILYSALLESVGIDAAFITTPGHIFVAVDTGLSPKQAATALIPADQIVVEKGKVWIPVEITLRHQGFLKAWELGAKEWHEANPQGNAGFYPVEDAWKLYAPVGLPGADPNITLPATKNVIAAYRTDVTAFIDEAIYPKVAQLRNEIAASGSTSAMNRLGILYAKYGDYGKATEQFQKILSERKNYLPALLNMGNLYYLRQNWEKARQYYGEASTLQPDNARVLLAVARVDQELENYGDARRSYEKLKAADPELAQRYSYLALGSSGNGRAADISAERREVVWEGE